MSFAETFGPGGSWSWGSLVRPCLLLPPFRVHLPIDFPHEVYSRSSHQLPPCGSINGHHLRPQLENLGRFIVPSYLLRTLGSIRIRTPKRLRRVSSRSEPNLNGPWY